MRGNLCGAHRCGNPCSAALKRKTPARPRSWRALSIVWRTTKLGVRGLPGDSRDFRAVDADVSELTVAEAGQLVQAAVVTAPGLEEADDGDEHGLGPLAFGPDDQPVNVMAITYTSMPRCKRNYIAVQLVLKRMAKSNDY